MPLKDDYTNGSSLQAADFNSLATTVNGLSTDVPGKQPKFMTGTCATASATAAKTVTLDSPWNVNTPVAGDWLLINFSNGHSIANPTLAVNGGIAYPIRTPNTSSNASNTATTAGYPVLLYFTGSAYILAGATGNTTYTEISAAEIVSTTDTNTRLISGQRAEALMANEATKARTLTGKTISGASNTLSNIAQSSVTNLTTDLGNKADVLQYTNSESLASGTNYKLLSLDLNPESAMPTFMPNFFNDLAFFTQRGGTYTVTKNGSPFSWDLTNCFKPDTSFALTTSTPTTDVYVITLAFPASLLQRYGTYMGIVFPHGFPAKDVTIEYQRDAAWTQVYSVTNAVAPVHVAYLAGSATSTTGLRYTLTNMHSGTHLRISSLFSFDYSSQYLGLGYVTRDGGALYGTTAAPPTLTATGGDTNIDLDLRSKGTGVVEANGIPVVTTTGTQTLENKTVQGYTESVVALGTVGAASTLAITAGTVLTATLTASTPCTFTMPAVGAGKSFTFMLKQAATGMTTATFTGVKWPNGGTAPTVTATAAKMDILSFFSDGVNWYGSAAQNYTP